jgi:hypothetical protein
MAFRLGVFTAGRTGATLALCDWLASQGGPEASWFPGLSSSVLRGTGPAKYFLPWLHGRTWLETAGG